MAKKRAKKEHKKAPKILKKAKASVIFLIGVIAVILFALFKSLNLGFAESKWVFLGFLILGIILGIIKKKNKKIHNMEVSVIALIVISSMIPTLLQIFGDKISGFVMNLIIYFLTLITPAVLILSINNLFVFFKKK